MADRTIAAGRIRAQQDPGVVTQRILRSSQMHPIGTSMRRQRMPDLNGRWSSGRVVGEYPMSRRHS
jgi:hypothetical protein